MNEQDRHELRELARRRMLGIPDEPLPDILRRYAEAHDLNRKTVNWHKCVMRRFGTFCGHPVTPDDFCPERANAWLTQELNEAKRSRVTIKSYRRCLLIIWRWGYDEGLLHHPPLKVKHIKAPMPVPSAFTLDEVLKMLEAAATLRGVFSNCLPRAPWYVALIRTAWDTGFRNSDLMHLRLEDFNENGQGALVQRKTGTTVFFTLRYSTLEAIKATNPHLRPFIFGGVVSKHKMYWAIRCIAMRAGVKGSLKKIRKGAASAVERMQPGHASRFLGHRTPGIAERHYLDPRVVNAERPMPPELCRKAVSA